MLERTTLDHETSCMMIMSVGSASAFVIRGRYFSMRMGCVSGEKNRMQFPEVFQ